MNIVCGPDGKPALLGRDWDGKAHILRSDPDIIELDAHRPHFVGYAICPCGHSSLAVVDARANLDTLQCASCMSMTASMQPDPPAIVTPLR